MLCLTAKKLSLKVQDSDPTHVGRNIVTLDRKSKTELEITSGDIVTIQGKKKTAAVVWPARAEDEGKGIIRMDNFIRHNSGASLTDTVAVEKCIAREVVEVILAPTHDVRIIASGYNRILKKNFLGRPMAKGDNIWISVFGSGFVYKVVSTKPNGIVKVTDSTRFVLREKPVKDTLEGIPSIAYEDIGGLKEQVRKVREMVELPMKHPELFRKLGIAPPKGVLLYGPPGTGKTLLAKAVANETNAHFISINAPEIMSKFVGEAEERIRQIFKDAEENAPSIIFIDELDSIAPKRDEVVGEVERRVVAQLLALMDGLEARGDVIVIAATNRINSLDEALRRPGRFDREIEIGIPDRKEREEILAIHTRGMPLNHFDPKEAAKELIKRIQTFEEELKNTIKLRKEELETEKEKLTKGGSTTAIQKLIDEIKKFTEKLIQEPKIVNKIQKQLEDDPAILEELGTELRNHVIELKKLEHGSELINGRDPRKIFIDNLEKKIDVRVKGILSELLELEVINLEFLEEIKTQSVPKLISKYAAVTHGFVGADLEALAKEAAMKALRRYLPEIDLEAEEIPESILERLEVNEEDFDEGLKDVQPSALREVAVKSPKVRWEDIGGLEEARKELKHAVEWPLKYPESFAKMGIRPPKGILLYGPPGTGKTLLAKAVATEAEANFISIKGPELLSMFVGESERGIRKIFRKARQVSPVIVFFDEIDSIASSRGNSHDSNVGSRVLDQLLTELDGLDSLKDVVFMAATNRPDLLDQALLRPGRIDKIIQIGAPDKASRLLIFKVHTKNTPLAKDVNLKDLADKTEGFSGADIEGLVQEAALMALEESGMKADKIDLKYFEKALEKKKPTLTPSTQKAYNEFEEHYAEYKPSYVG